MLGIDDSEQKAIEMERVRYPGIIIVSFPIICCFMSVLVLGTLPWLIGAYNYLRGASSPIDQSILALLGSDLSRLVVLTSCITGMMIGLYLSRFVTTKLDVVKKEGEAELSTRMYTTLLIWWVLPLLPLNIISLLDLSINGFYTSRFLSDFGFFMMAGYFLAYSIPVLSKYILLALYTKSIDSQVVLVGIPRGSGFKKRFQNLTLKIIHEGPDP